MTGRQWSESQKKAAKQKREENAIMKAITEHVETLYGKDPSYPPLFRDNEKARLKELCLEEMAKFNDFDGSGGRIAAYKIPVELSPFLNVVQRKIDASALEESRATKKALAALKRMELMEAAKSRQSRQRHVAAAVSTGEKKKRKDVHKMKEKEQVDGVECEEKDSETGEEPDDEPGISGLTGPVHNHWDPQDSTMVQAHTVGNDVEGILCSEEAVKLFMDLVQKFQYDQEARVEAIQATNEPTVVPLTTAPIVDGETELAQTGSGIKRPRHHDDVEPLPVPKRKPLNHDENVPHDRAAWACFNLECKDPKSPSSETIVECMLAHGFTEFNPFDVTPYKTVPVGIDKKPCKYVMFFTIEKASLLNEQLNDLLESREYAQLARQANSAMKRTDPLQQLFLGVLPTGTALASFALNLIVASELENNGISTLLSPKELFVWKESAEIHENVTLNELCTGELTKYARNAVQHLIADRRQRLQYMSKGYTERDFWQKMPLIFKKRIGTQ